MLNKGVAIYVALVVAFGVAASLPVLAAFAGWIADDTVTYFLVLSGPPFGVLVVGQDLLLRPFLRADLAFAPQAAIWLAGSLLYYGLIFGPAGAVLTFSRGRLSQWREYETLVGLQFLLIVLHCFAAYLAFIMLQA